MDQFQLHRCVDCNGVPLGVKHCQVTCANPNARSAYFWNYPSPPNTNCQAAPGPFPELIVVVCQPDGTFQYLGDTIGAFICQIP
ncbi:hypothetical protein WR25_09649 [Diploscapter pachys]|uniref:Uncharacterized protein n=1 Tax=Diploscapter pachys TaxID=2018661 RepID=A0A2A2J588_9BILA|nr:hypothetical protein WR25_09649 [Diploscapter pachys]